MALGAAGDSVHLSEAVQAAEAVQSREAVQSTGAVQAAATSSAYDWSQWRGPERDGAVEPWLPGWLPSSLPETLQRRWKVETTRGHGDPVVAGGRVYVHGRQGDRELLSAFSLSDGTLQWSRHYEAPFTTNQYATAHGQGPFSTPLVADGRVFAVGTSGILSAFDAASGELLWRHDESPRVSSAKLFTGTAASPLLDLDGEIQRLILHLGDDSGGRVYAFEPATGKVLWKTSTEGPGYASPIVIEGPGGRQAVTMTDKTLLSVAVASGEVLWTLPFPDEWNENIVTPVPAGDALVFGGVRTGILALELESGEEGIAPKERWRRKEPTLYMSTPVVVGETLWGFSNKQKGHFFTLDLGSGEVTGTGEGRQGDNAHLLDAGAHIVALTTGGELLALEKGARGFAPVARWQVADSATWAAPVPVPGGVLIRDLESLSLWTFPSPPAEPKGKAEAR